VTCARTADIKNKYPQSDQRPAFRLRTHTGPHYEPRVGK
jgi:hypothetical protein